jgi:hypothetical protein
MSFVMHTWCYEENGEGGGTSDLSTPSSISVFAFFFCFFATFVAFLGEAFFDALLLLFVILFFLAIASSSAAKQTACRYQPRSADSEFLRSRLSRSSAW